MTDFASLGLNPLLVRVINDAGYSAPTEIQTRAVPEVMTGKDVMACAQTGTGKTAAFVLPCIHRLIAKPSQSQRHGPRVLVLTPTRELAQQVTDNIHKFSKGLRIRSGVVVGGVSYGPQYRLLTQPLDILVATPGRLIDHLNEGRVDFSRVETLVLDEADRMLDMGFLKPVERILDAVCKTTTRPQILLFSATFTDSVEKVAGRVLQSPARIQLVAPKQNHKLITQRVFQADDKEHKMALLAEMLKDPEMGQVIVFAATKRSADRMAEKLERAGHKAAAMHGDMKQNARKRVLAQMHEGKLKVLVATDVAARGIDVKQLSHVINFDMPQVAEDYVHRIGRTGRAGETGIALSMITPEDLPLWRDIEKLLDKSFAFERLSGFEPRMSVEDFRATNMPRPQRGRKPQGGQRGGFRGNGGGRRDFGGRDGGFSGQRREFGSREQGFGGEGRRESGFGSQQRRDEGFRGPRQEHGRRDDRREGQQRQGGQRFGQQRDRHSGGVNDGQRPQRRWR